jgi:hypothetical protein
MLPQGAKLAVAYPTNAVNFVPVPEVHLAVVAVARREAFVPTLFAYQGQQPVTLKQRYAALADAATPQDLWSVFRASRSPGETAGLLRALQPYDFVAVTGGETSDVPPTKCLRPFFRQPTFEIFAVLHDATCASPEG